MNTPHLELMPKPRLVREVHTARADTARALELADYWRDYADRMAIARKSDQSLIRALRLIVQASRAVKTLRSAA